MSTLFTSRLLATCSWVCSLYFLFCSAAPINTPTSPGPVIVSNFPDPSIIQVGGTWYAFATNGNGVNIQLATSPDFATWTVQSGYDALPTLGGWASSGRIWAPDVIQRPDGSFVMYYSAPIAGNAAHHCVGAATASSVGGPYTPLPGPLACPDPSTQGGAIDADGFQDPVDGSQYVVYKVDGNSLGHGGSCMNGVAPFVPTPIMLQKVAADGVTLEGGPTQLLDRTDADGPLIEAPSLVRTSDGVYTLFYSSNCYTSPDYSVKYVTATSVYGPYTNPQTLLATNSVPNLVAPGGADVSTDGTKIVFHSDIGNSVANGREMWAALLSGL